MAKKLQPKGAKAPARSKKPGRAPAKRPVKPRAKAAGTTTKAEDKVDVFLREYIVDFNGRRAAIAAGYAASGARVRACELLKQPAVSKRLDALLAERAERTGITADLVLHRLQAVATADPRELTEVHRGACRFCWGRGHAFQFTTSRELEQMRFEHAMRAAEHARRIKDQPELGLPEYPEFDETGGTGFNPANDPNPSCPECHGEGETRVVAKDTRDLSPAARLLYAGAKQTQHGLEVRMHDQLGAVRDIGKHLGLFRDKVELTGKNGGPVEHGYVIVPAKADADDGGD